MNSNAKLNKFNLMYIVIYSFVVFTPYIFRNMGIPGMVCIILFSLLVLLINVLKNIQMGEIVVYTVIYLIILAIYFVLKLPDAALGNYIYYILYFLPASIYYYLKKNNLQISKKEKMVLILIFIINIIINIYILFENPYAAKELTGSYGEEKLIGTNLVTDINMLSVVIFLYYLILRKNSSNKRIIYFILILLTCSMLLISSFFIAILSAIVMLIVHYLSVKEGKSKIIRIVITMGIIILIVLISKLNYLNIINRLNNIDNYIVRERLISIVNTLTGKNSPGSMEARLDDILISIKTYLKNIALAKMNSVKYLMSQKQHIII